MEEHSFFYSAERTHDAHAVLFCIVHNYTTFRVSFKEDNMESIYDAEFQALLATLTYDEKLIVLAFLDNLLSERKNTPALAV